MSKAIRLVSHKELAGWGITYTKESLWRLERDGKFPKRIGNGRRVQWVESEIDAYIMKLVEERDHRGPRYPAPAELEAIAETAFREASSGNNAEALGLAAVIRDTLHTADLFDELEALNIVTARTFEGFDAASRASIIEKYINLMRSRAFTAA